MNVLLPFEKLIDFIFLFSFELTASPGLSLVVLSVLVSSLLIPVNSIVNRILKRQEPIREKMKAVQSEIERVYFGYTRYLYLKTLFRQNNYKSYNAYLSLIVPLVQIPFFIAAYKVLSESTLLNARDFFIIQNLGVPDGLIPFGGIKLNALPVLMTLINLVNVYFVGSKKINEKVFLTVFAIIFLVLLYNMPSGLVLYWLMNNFFSLILAFKKDGFSFLQINLKKEKIPYLELSQGLVLVVGLLGISKIVTVSPLSQELLVGFVAFFFSILAIIAFLSRAQKNINRYPWYCLFLLATFPVGHFCYTNIDYLNYRFILEIILWIILPQLLFILLMNRFYSKTLQILITGFFLSFNLSPLFLSLIKISTELSFYYRIIFMLLCVAPLFMLAKSKKSSFILICVLFGFAGHGRFLFKWVKTEIVNQFTSTAVKFPDYLPKNLTHKPDIYFLVYDAYSNEPFLNHIGFDNSVQLNLLKTRGFKNYQDKLSLYGYSLPSISGTYLFKNVESQAKARTAMVGNNPIDLYFKSMGYEMIYVAHDYFFRNQEGVAKSRFHTASQTQNTLLHGLIVGEFKFKMETEEEIEDYWKNKWIPLKARVLSEKHDKPRLFYSHSSFPGHTQNSGQCLPHEMDLYKTRVLSANTEMISDVDLILKQNPDAIIIIAGDHGPFLFGDCYKMNGFKSSEINGMHLYDRFGVQVSIRWPEYLKNQVNDNFSYLQGALLAVISTLSNDKSVMKFEPKGSVCVQDVCGSKDSPINAGPDKGKMILNSL